MTVIRCTPTSATAAQARRTATTSTSTAACGTRSGYPGEPQGFVIGSAYHAGLPAPPDGGLGEVRLWSGRMGRSLARGHVRRACSLTARRAMAGSRDGSGPGGIGWRAGGEGDVHQDLAAGGDVEAGQAARRERHRGGVPRVRGASDNGPAAAGCLVPAAGGGPDLAAAAGRDAADAGLQLGPPRLRRVPYRRAGPGNRAEHVHTQLPAELPVRAGAAHRGTSRSLGAVTSRPPGPWRRLARGGA